MDLEQLKLFVEAIEGIGGDAFTFGMWWLAVQCLSPSLWFAFGVLFIYWITRLAYKSFALSYGCSRIAHAIGHKVYGDFDNTDADACIQLIESLKAGSGKKKTTD